MIEKQKCEICGQWKPDAFRRADHGQTACGECDQDIVRADSPTGLVPRLKLAETPEWMQEA